MSAAKTWVPPLNPASPDLYGVGNDVDWLKGEYVMNIEAPQRFHEMNPWVPAGKPTAERIVSARHDEVLAVLGALYSWRVCTVSQLQAGLSEVPLPDFDRTDTTLYGALLRLGCINVGFSSRERWENVTVPEAWLSIGVSGAAVKRVLKIIGATPAEKTLVTSTSFKSVRRHARHNTYAAHLGLTCAQDGRVDFACGDGWSGFKNIDPQANNDAGLANGCAADVAVMCNNGVLAGIEVQSNMRYIIKKLDNWTRLLVNSPLSRRGLVCVWLVIGRNGMPMPTNVGETMTDLAKQLDGLTVGVPQVGMRLGWAYWDDWYDAKGRPTEKFGAYTDMFNHHRTIFDPQWASFTPAHETLDHVGEWGWHSMRRQLKAYWGWDMGMWNYPDEYRGGVLGFVSNGKEEN